MNKDCSNLIKRLEEIMFLAESDAEGEPSAYVFLLSEIIATLESQDAQNVELMSALKPFADSGRFTKTYEYSEDTEMAIPFTWGELNVASTTYEKNR